MHSPPIRCTVFSGTRLAMNRPHEQRQRGHRHEGDRRTDGRGPGTVARGEVRGGDLGQVTPLTDEDRHERRRVDRPEPRDGLDLLVLLLVTRTAAQQHERAEREEGGRDELDDPVGQQADQPARSDRDGDVHDESGRGAEPDVERPHTGAHGQRGEHRLVGELREEDQAEGGENRQEVEMHSGWLSVRAGPRAVREAPLGLLRRTTRPGMTASPAGRGRVIPDRRSRPPVRIYEPGHREPEGSSVSTTGFRGYSPSQPSTIPHRTCGWAARYSPGTTVTPSPGVPPHEPPSPQDRRNRAVPAHGERLPGLLLRHPEDSGRGPRRAARATAQLPRRGRHRAGGGVPGRLRARQRHRRAALGRGPPCRRPSRLARPGQRPAGRRRHRHVGGEGGPGIVDLPEILDLYAFSPSRRIRAGLEEKES